MNSLTIERANGIYLIPRRHPGRAAVKRRLDRVITDRLPTALGTLAGSTLGDSAPELWLVRRLDVDLSVDLGMVDDVSLAEALGSRVTQELRRTLAGGPDGDNVLRFEDRAAFIADFVYELSIGRAWGRWWSREFGGLRSLGPGAAVREVLRSEPMTAPAVIRRLTRDDRLGRVLGALSELQARDILKVVRDEAAGSSVGDLSPRALARIWTDHPPASAWGPARAQLHLVARSLAGGDEGVSHVLLLRTETMVQRAQTLSRDQSRAFFSALASGGNLADATRAVNLTGVPEVDSTIFDSRFIGVFLLLDSLVALDLPFASDEEHPATAAAVRAMVLGLCFGRDQARAAFRDPGVRLAAGLPQDAPDPIKTLARETQLGPRVENGLLQALFEGGGARCRWLAAEVLPGQKPGGSVLLLRDIESDFWPIAANVAAKHDLEPTLDAMLERIAQVTGDDPKLVHLPPGSREGSAGFGLRTRDSGPTSEATQRAIKTYLGAVRPAADHLAYFYPLPADVAGILSSTGLALTLTATAVMRHFARRLIGFGWSTPAYLRSNFLEGSGRVTVHADQIRVDLPATPLQVVLRMAGVTHGGLRAPWLDAQEIELSLPEG